MIFKELSMADHDTTSHDAVPSGRKSKKRVTQEQIEKTREGLKNLSQSPFIIREMAIKKLSEECLELLKKGYSYADLVHVFRSNGIVVSEPVLRDVLTGKIDPENIETTDTKSA